MGNPDHFSTVHDHINSRARECLMEEIPDGCEIEGVNVGGKSLPIDHVDKVARNELFARIANPANRRKELDIMANQECRYCRNRAVYWDSIRKVIMCHACGMVHGIEIRVG